MVKKPRDMERHHRLPRSRGGSDHITNVSLVEKDLHRAWHRLVGNMNAEEVAAMLTDTWIDANFYLVAIPRKKKRSKRRKRRYCIDCEAEVLKHIPIKRE